MVTINKSYIHMNRLHDTIPLILGGVPADFLVTGKGNLITVAVLNEDLGITDEILAAYLDKWNSLSLNAVPQTIIANETEEAVITCPGQTIFTYYLWVENRIVQTAEVNDGEVRFSTGTPGIYVIEFRKSDGTSGYVEVIANDQI